LYGGSTVRARDSSASALLVAAVVLGGTLRFWGIGLGIPFHFHPDEHLVLRGTAALGRSVREATEITYYFTYGTFPRLVLGAVTAVVQRLHDFRADDPASIRLLYLLARSIAAAAGTATIIVVYALGRRMWGAPAGALAAALLSVSVLHMRDSHFYTVDSLWALLLTVLVLLSWEYHRSRRPGLLVGMAVTAGAALATKLSTVLCLGPVLAVVLWQVADGTGGVKAAASRIGAFAGGTVLAFLVFNFPVLVNPAAFLDTVKTLLGWATGGGTIRQSDLQFVGTTPYAYWLTNLLPWGLGPFLTLASLASVAVHLRRPTRASLLVCSMVIPYFLVQASSFQKFVRFTLPLYPGFCLLVGSWLAGSPPRRWKHVLVAVVLAGSGFYCLAYHGIFRSEDVRIRAARWINARLAPGDVVVLEPAHINPPVGALLDRPDFWRSYVPPPDPHYEEARGGITVRYLDTYRHLYSGGLSDDQKEAYIHTVLDGADWVVVTPRYRDQYLRLPQRYPVMAHHYDDLLSGRRGFEVVRVFRELPRLAGVQIDDSSSELTFRLFDHPTIWILRRACR
jgi:hypothetical protein